MGNRKITDKDVQLQEFKNQENNKIHITNRDDMEQYELLRKGDLRAAAVAVETISSEKQGVLSSDPLQNIKYLFVCGATIAIRVCIESGLNEKTAFTISDLHIQQMDLCKKKEEVITLYGEMFSFLTRHIQELRTANIYSKPIVSAINYIYNNLHYSIRTEDIANEVNLNASYLSTLFKKETGMTITDYVLETRITQAQNLLKFSDYSLSEIAVYLSFGSQSYFIRQFKKITGMTPKEYRSNMVASGSTGTQWNVGEQIAMTPIGR